MRWITLSRHRSKESQWAFSKVYCASRSSTSIRHHCDKNFILNSWIKRFTRAHRFRRLNKSLHEFLADILDSKLKFKISSIRTRFQVQVVEGKVDMPTPNGIHRSFKDQHWSSHVVLIIIPSIHWCSSLSNLSFLLKTLSSKMLVKGQSSSLIFRGYLLENLKF